MTKDEFQNIQKKLRLTNQGVANTLGVKFRTVERWADGTWEIPLMAEKFLYFLRDRGN